MSKTYQGGVSVLTPFEVQADGPIADYMVVDSTTDLVTLREFTGMLVYVVNGASFYYFNGTIWVKLEAGTGGGTTTDYFGVAGYDGTIAYDVDDNIDTITYSNGVILTFNYTTGNLTSVTSNTSKSKNLFYDVDENLVGFSFT